MRNTSTQDTRNLWVAVNNFKSTGYSNLSAPSSLPQSLILHSVTLSCGHPPASWKHSIVTPIPKVNPPQQLSDLRPISVTPVLSRCFEILFVKHHFSPAVPTSDIKDLFAFQSTGSTTSALIHFLVMLLGSWSPTPLLGAFLSISANGAPKPLNRFT